MEMTACNSSQLKSFGYDPDTRALSIEFHTGATYTFRGVPQEVVTGMAEAESIGRFFGAHVRGKFDYSRAPDPEEASPS